jgi:hypothetical protein
MNNMTSCHKQKNELWQKIEGATSIMQTLDESKGKN